MISNQLGNNTYLDSSRRVNPMNSMDKTQAPMSNKKVQLQPAAWATQPMTVLARIKVPRK